MPEELELTPEVTPNTETAVDSQPTIVTDNLDFDDGADDVPAPSTDSADVATGADPKADPFDAEILSIAKELGISEERARAFGDVGKLESALKLVAEQKAAAEVRQPDRQPQPPTAPQLPTVDRFNIDVNKLKEAGFDPALVEVLTQMNEHYHKHIEQAHQSVAQQQQQQMLREWNSFESRFDSMIEKLGPSWESVLGKGKGVEMDQNSKAYKDRIRVIEMMAKSGMDEQQAFEFAVHGLFHKHIKELAKSELTQKVEKRANGAIQRPTNRRGSDRTLKGDEKAVQFVREFIASKGGIGDDDGDSDF